MNNRESLRRKLEIISQIFEENDSNTKEEMREELKKLPEEFVRDLGCEIDCELLRLKNEYDLLRQISKNLFSGKHKSLE